jgi:hypothetical protein
MRASIQMFGGQRRAQIIVPSKTVWNRGSVMASSPQA